MADLPRGTVTFLFTDIEGSTALWERDRPVMMDAVERHLAPVRATLLGSGHSLPGRSRVHGSEGISVSQNLGGGRTQSHDANGVMSPCPSGRRGDRCSDPPTAG